jgi:hypothetical protein
MSPFLIPLGAFVMVLGIVGLDALGKTIRHYLDWRLRMAERQSGIGDRNVLQVMQELRAEVSALKQHEAEAVLSFDSTLQTLDARVKHLERRALSQGAGERTPVGAGASVEETTRLTARGS